MSTGLYLLRCVRLGLSMRDLDSLTIGMVYDMYAEAVNDESGDYANVATQEDIDRFFGRC